MTESTEVPIPEKATTAGIAPKAVAGTLAAVVGPLLADLFGADSVALTALVTTVLVALAAYFAPPAGITGDETGDGYAPDEDQLPTYMLDTPVGPDPVQDQGDAIAAGEHVAEESA